MDLAASSVRSKITQLIDRVFTHARGRLAHGVQNKLDEMEVELDEAHDESTALRLQVSTRNV